MKADNILADDMDICWPETAENRPFLCVANACHIGCERINPYIHDMVRRTRHFDAPIKAGARYAQILQSAFDEAKHFIAAAFGADKFGLFGKELEQWFLIFRQAKEPGFFGCPLNGRPLWRQLRARSIGLQLTLIIESLIANRIPAFVSIKVKVACCFHRLPQSLASNSVPGFGGADECVERYVKFRTHIFEIACHFIREFKRLAPCRPRSLDHFEAMFIRAGHKADIAAHEPLKTRNGVGCNGFISMADVRLTVGIGYCGGDIKGFA